MDTQSEYLLSVVIPAYNEGKTIAETIQNVRQTSFKVEIIVVDDGSADDTAAVVHNIGYDNIRLILHGENKGKGAALSTGFDAARGDIILIQDADLEYNPECFQDLLEPIMSGKADVVYGSRFLGNTHRVLYFWHYVANRILTLWSNIWCNRNFSDMETGYKVFKREVIAKIRLKEKRFGVEPEITQKLARSGWRIFEVPITYYGRTYEAGKKIGFMDAIRAFWCVMRYAIKD